MNFTKTILAAALTLSAGALAYAQNPIINSAYCADPSARPSVKLALPSTPQIQERAT